MKDTNRSITVEDLIRKYNLDGLKNDRQTIKVLDNQLTKTDGIVSDFVEQTTRDIENLQDQIDGNITSWFYSGVPTLLNEPAVNWTTDTEKDQHLGDMYYDNDEGTAYRFIKDNGTYQWNKLSDDAVARALALANTALDTADSKRRVFITQPVPPYDAGDIWWTSNELFRCVVGRVESDTYHSTDWVNDLKYTDDTAANNAIAQLDDFQEKVFEDYTTNATFYTETSKIEGRIDENRNLVANVNNELVNYKNEVSSTFTQQANQFSLEISSLNETINETRNIAESNSTKEYLRFSQGTGVEIGATNSPFKVNITNQEFNIQQNGNKVAYVNDKKLYITEAEILQRLYMGNFGFVVNQDKSLSLRKVRDL